MAEIINLRMARKAKARQEAQSQAQANRASHGRTKAERQNAKDERTRLIKAVEAARREID